ncbi:MAG: DegV family protein [Firmicutes bacterium]|nr:DegV family protein [Bacillota bacterium]
MNLIAIVTDSSAGVPQEIAQKLNLNIVPVGVQINNKIYREGIDLPVDDFYEQLDKTGNVSTSQPAPGDFLNVYRKVAEKAKEIISIHVTSLGSGTVNVANLIKRQISIPVSVIDSKTASMAQGFMALAAAKAAQAGKTREEILSIVENVRKQTAIFVAVPTLKYLARSGRVSSVKNLIASALSLKPILGVNNGLVDVIEKVRSYPKAVQRLITLIEERFEDINLNIAVLHTNAPVKAEEFRVKIEKRFKNARIFVTEISASLAVHGGQGMLGVAAYSGLDLD